MEENLENKHTVTVIIGGRPYPLKIKAEDEAVIRRIVHEVNEKVNQFQLAYPNKDKQDCLSMTLLTYAVDLAKSQQPEEASVPNDLLAKLSHLDQLLSNVLDQG